MSKEHRVPVEERLFSLVLALLATEHGLTKAEILSTVNGYAHRYDTGGDNTSLERQFERDKDDIRELGVPLDTIEDPADAGNNQLLRYVIPRDAYELPDDIDFSAEESALLGLAAMTWREGSMSKESQRALLKIKALGVPLGSSVLDYAPRLRVRDAAFEPLHSAIGKGLIVRFPYLKPGEVEASMREVAPRALVQFQGRWHVSAVLPATGQYRTFLLRRITGDVIATRTVHAAPSTDEAATALAELGELWDRNIARVRVTPGTDADARLRKRRGTAVDGAVFSLHYTDIALLAEELSSFGAEVLVLDPAELVDAVRANLQTVADAHEGGVNG